MPIRRRRVKRPIIRSHVRFGRKIRRLERLIVTAAAFLALAVLIWFLYVALVSPAKKLDIPAERAAAFQIPYQTLADLKTISEKYGMGFSELLAVYCVENSFFPNKTEAPAAVDLERRLVSNYSEIKSQYDQKALRAYITMFDGVLRAMTLFPVPQNYDTDAKESYMYGDNWGQRHKGLLSGSKEFDGVDIFDRENVAGRIPVVSVSGGVISDMGIRGALGNTLTILSDTGVTFAYANLDRFADNLSAGSAVSAGQVVGYMGSSGLKDNQSNAAGHQVRLHFGISASESPFGKDFWINPYPFLRLMESSKADLIPAS